MWQRDILRGRLGGRLSGPLDAGGLCLYVVEEFFFKQDDVDDLRVHRLGKVTCFLCFLAGEPQGAVTE